VVLSAIVGTSIFSTLGQAQVSALWQVLIGLLSVSAAVLAALQTFLGYSDRAAKHSRAAHEFAAIRREIQQLETRGINSSVEDELTHIREQITMAGENAPNIPNFARKEAEKREYRSRELLLDRLPFNFTDNA